MRAASGAAMASLEEVAEEHTGGGCKWVLRKDIDADGVNLQQITIGI